MPVKRPIATLRVAVMVVLAAGVVLWVTHQPPGSTAAFAGSPGPGTSTSRAPSPEVPRSWAIVGLGDSVMSGARCDCSPFIDRYGALVASSTHRATTVHNLGVSGSTSRDLLDALQPGGILSQGLRGADIVALSIGANDMAVPRREWEQDACATCFAATASTIETDLVEIIRRVRAATGRAPVEVLVTTYWNVFEEAEATGSGPDHAAYTAMADAATKEANRAICAAAEKSNAACVDLYRPFKGDGADDSHLLAGDRDHPNATGHQLIASRLAAYGWRELGVPRSS